MAEKTCAVCGGSGIYNGERCSYCYGSGKLAGSIDYNSTSSPSSSSGSKVNDFGPVQSNLPSGWAQKINNEIHQLNVAKAQSDSDSQTNDYNQAARAFNAKDWNGVFNALNPNKATSYYKSAFFQRYPLAKLMQGMALANVKNDYTAAFECGYFGNYGGNDNDMKNLSSDAIIYGKQAWERVHGRAMTYADLLSIKLVSYEKKLAGYVEEYNNCTTSESEETYKIRIWSYASGWEDVTGKEMDKKEQIRIANKTFPGKRKEKYKKKSPSPIPPHLSKLFSAPSTQAPSSTPTKGKKTYANGDIYEGDWVDDNKHGKGKYTYANGDIYEGNFVDGNFHGKGKYTYADGGVYEGDWVDNKIHGKGKYTFSNGAVYEGDWVDGKKHGKGKYTTGDGGSLYEGDFVDGKQTGKGKYKWLNEGIFYEGDFVDGNFHGKGKKTYPDGKIEEGDWEDDQFVG